jgi:hypothetical protein
MKKLLLSFLFIFIWSFASGMRVPENPGEASVWFNRISEGINRLSKSSDTKKAISGLGEYVRKLGRRADHPDARWREAYILAKFTLLTIPGHAEYFRDEIENERMALEPESYRGSYDRNRIWLFETFHHLPSPETIRVLGDFLEDERDLGQEPAWTSDGLLMGLNPNSRLALKALNNIGLRDPGFSAPKAGEWPDAKNYATREEAKLAAWNYSDNKLREEVAPWRVWFAKVKSGHRTFSFKGEAVEYRFNPDGTWVTLPLTNPPDDAPELPNITDSAEKTRKIPITKAQPEELDNPTSRNLLIGLAALMALAGAWFSLRRMKPR